MRLTNRRIFAGGLAAVATAGLVATTMVPANADPIRSYAATGSDTIQDVYNALTNGYGTIKAPIGSIASYDAIPGTAANAHQLIKTKSNGAWFPRPNGSGEGILALSSAQAHVNLPSTSTIAWHFSSFTTILQNGEVDVARSSSGPGTSGIPSSGTYANNGLTYMPFARDAVSIALVPTTGLTPTELKLNADQIKELYLGVNDTTDDVAQVPLTTNVTVAVTGGGTGVTINGVAVHPKLPQLGSGSRKFFLKAITGSETPTHTAVTGPPAIPAVASYVDVDDNTVYEENNAAALSAADVFPFSAAQWIAQKNGVAPTNNTGSAILGWINGLAPTQGTGTNLTPGDLFEGTGTSPSTFDSETNTYSAFGAGDAGSIGEFARDTFSVVDHKVITAVVAPPSSPEYNPARANLRTLLAANLVSSDAQTIIRKFGFGVLTYAGNGSYTNDAYKS